MSLPVAARWYETEALEHGVTLIDEIHVAPLARSNIWLVRGSTRDLLVDTGTGVGPLRETVERLTDRPVLAVATLGYYDHAGGLHRFDERLIHRLDADRVANPSPRKIASERYVEGAFKALPHAGFEPARYSMPPSEPTRLLEDGEVIDLGDRRFEVVHLPGITAGTSGLFERATGILFTGDALSYDRGYLYDGEPADYSDDADREAFKASLRRLKTLPIGIVHPGHFARFDRARMIEIIDRYLAEH